MKQYYYLSSDRKQQGPVPEERLRALLVAGIVSADTLIWGEGMPGWQPLSNVLPTSASSLGQQESVPTPAPQQRHLSCLDYFVLCITKKYASFSGRATRKEYWSFQVLGYILGFILGYILAGEVEDEEMVSLLLIGVILAAAIPSWAVTVRRLHDSNHSGWLSLIQLVPYIGVIIVLVICLQDSYRGTNQYGPSEKYPD